MRDARIHVERAAAGLVIALFLAAALLVGYIFFRTLQDYKARTTPPEKAISQVFHHEPRLPDLPQLS